LLLPAFSSSRSSSLSNTPHPLFSPLHFTTTTTTTPQLIISRAIHIKQEPVDPLHSSHNLHLIIDITDYIKQESSNPPINHTQRKAANKKKRTLEQRQRRIQHCANQRAFEDKHNPEKRQADIARRRAKRERNRQRKALREDAVVTKVSVSALVKIIPGLTMDDGMLPERVQSSSGYARKYTDVPEFVSRLRILQL
jgi:hypothetical protein